MGKPFAAELAKLPSTLDWVQALDVSQLSEFLSHAEGNHL